MLNCYAFLKNPHRWEPPAPEIRYLGALLRRRDVLLGDALREEVRNIERQIKVHIKASPALRVIIHY